MAFQAPRIIGGGQIIQPQQQGNPFQSITDELDKYRDHQLKEKALKLEASKEYAKLSGISDPSDANYMPFDEWYSGPAKTNFLDLAKGKIGQGADLAKGKIGEGIDLAREKIGYGEGQWAPGKFIAQGIGKGYDAATDYLQSNKQPSNYHFREDMKERFGDTYYNWGDESDIKEFQHDHMGMSEGDEGFGIYGEKTKAKRQEVFGMQKGGQAPAGYSLVGGGDIPGKRTGDVNPAMLEDGEYVLNRNAVNAIGKENLDYINDERYPRFQMGGFNDPGIAGGTAQIIRPNPMDNSKAFDFLGGGGGGSEGGGAGGAGGAGGMMDMLMMVGGMQRGGSVPGYQFGGGFQSPGAVGGGGTVIQPKPMDNSQAFDFLKKKNEGSSEASPEASSYGGGTEMTSLSPQDMDALPQGMDMDFMSFMAQEGGYVPHDRRFGWEKTDEYQQGGPVRRRTGYIQGGYYPSTRQGTLTNEELEQQQRNLDWEDHINRMGSAYDYDVNAYEKAMDSWQRGQERGPKSWLRYLGDVLTPEGPMSSLLSAATGMDVTGGFSGLPAAYADEYIRDYRESHLSDAFNPSNVPEDVRMGEAEYQLLKTRGGTPTASTDARLSTDALKKKWYEESESNFTDEGFNAMDWINKMYGGGGR